MMNNTLRCRCHFDRQSKSCFTFEWKSFIFFVFFRAALGVSNTNKYTHLDCNMLTLLKLENVMTMYLDYSTLIPYYLSPLVSFSVALLHFTWFCAQNISFRFWFVIGFCFSLSLSFRLSVLTNQSNNEQIFGRFITQLCFLLFFNRALNDMLLWIDRAR